MTGTMSVLTVANQKKMVTLWLFYHSFTLFHSSDDCQAKQCSKLLWRFLK